MQGMQFTRAHRCGAQTSLCWEEEGGPFGILAHGPAPTLLRHWSIKQDGWYQQVE